MMLDLLQCPTCHGELVSSPDHLDCPDCGARYPIREGIPDLVPKQVDVPEPYRTERMLNAMAGSYGVAMPLLSATLWRCSPLRFVDWAHMAVGAGRGHCVLSTAITTGRLLAHVWGEHLRYTTLVGIDESWNMLRQAQRTLRKLDAQQVMLIRATPSALPFKPGSFRAVLSFNRLHTLVNRHIALQEMARVGQRDGVIAGSTLIRGQERLVDALLGITDRKGMAPLPRGRDFVRQELENCGERVLIETYGAVLFFKIEQLQAQASAIHTRADA